MLNIITKPIPGKKIMRFILFFLILHVNLYAQNLLKGPEDILFDQANDRYLVTNWAGNRIVAIDLDGNQQVFIDNIPHAHGMECRNSVLYVASDQNLILIDLSTAEIIEKIQVKYSKTLSHISLDASHYVYMTDWTAKKLFRIDLNNKSSMILYSFDFVPGGVSFDDENNRLIILAFLHNAPILGYNLSTQTISTIKNTSIDNPVAICQDMNKDYYITAFATRSVYKIENNFSSGPQKISSGHKMPSGLGYNQRDNIIGVTNYDSNSIDLISLETTDVDDEQEIKLVDHLLSQNYPNPFNGSTIISYTIVNPGNVILEVYDCLGRKVQTLVDDFKPSGTYSVQFDAIGNHSKIFYYTLIVGDKLIKTNKMIYTK